jgi:integrase
MTARRQAGEGGISAYDTKAGPRYRIHWREPVDPDQPNGPRRQRTRNGFQDKRTAAAELRTILASQDAGRYVRGTDVTVGEYAKTWITTKRLSPSTEAMYRRYLRLHVEPYVGHVAIKDVRPSTLSGLYRQLEECGRRQAGHEGGGLSPNTVLKVHVLVGAVLQSAVDDQLILANPARHPRASPPTPRQVRQAAPELRPWTAEELHRFLAFVERRHEDPLRRAWTLLAYTGLRRGELLGLRWGDIDMAGGALSVRRAVVEVRERDKPSQVLESLTKSGRARVVLLGRAALDALRARRSDAVQVNVALLGKERPVFLRDDGRVFTPDALLKQFKRTIAAHNAACARGDELPVVRLHDLRHTHATMLLQAGVHPRVVQERLGHRSITVTLEIYSHVLPRSQRSAAEALDDISGTEGMEASRG